MASLLDVPAELLWEVGLNLSDKDIAALRVSCRTLQANLDAAGFHFWRMRFLANYDHPKGVQDAPEQGGALNKELMTIYQQRQSFVARSTSFARGSYRECHYTLLHLRSIIRESFSDEGDSSLNLEVIRRFCSRSDFLEMPLHDNVRGFMLQGNPPRLGPFGVNYVAHMCVLFPFARFDTGEIIITRRLGDVFREAQKQVYRFGEQFALFKYLGDGQVGADLWWLMHATLFWRWHLSNERAFTIYRPYEALKDAERLRSWNTRLKTLENAAPVGTQLLGTWGGLERRNYSRIQDADNDNGPFEDHIALCGRGTLFLRYYIAYKQPHEVGATEWRPYEQMIPAHLHHSDPGFQARCLFFTITSQKGAYDDRIFEGKGWLSPLPPQGGLRGWQRMVIVGYERDSYGNIVTPPDRLYIHEAIVMPGGNLVFGRFWTDADGGEEAPMCPFIMWNVTHRPGIDPEPTVDEEEYADGYSPFDSAGDEGQQI